MGNVTHWVLVLITAGIVLGGMYQALKNPTGFNTLLSAGVDTGVSVEHSLRGGTNP